MQGSVVQTSRLRPLRLDLTVAARFNAPILPQHKILIIVKYAAFSTLIPDGAKRSEIIRRVSNLTNFTRWNELRIKRRDEI